MTNIWKDILCQFGILKGQTTIKEIIVEYNDGLQFPLPINIRANFEFNIIKNQFNLHLLSAEEFYAKWLEVHQLLKAKGRKFSRPTRLGLKSNGEHPGDVKYVSITTQNDETDHFKTTYMKLFWINNLFFDLLLNVVPMEYPIKLTPKKKIPMVSAWFLPLKEYLSPHIKPPSGFRNFRCYSWEEGNTTHINKVVEFTIDSSSSTLDLNKDTPFFVFPGILYSFLAGHPISELYFSDSTKIFIYPISILNKYRTIKFVVRFSTVNNYFFSFLEWWHSYSSDKDKLLKMLGPLYYFTELYNISTSEILVIICDAIIDSAIAIWKQKKELKPADFADALTNVLQISRSSIYEQTLRLMANFRGLLVHKFKSEYLIDGHEISLETMSEMRKFVELLAFLCTLYLLCQITNVGYNNRNDIDYLISETRELLNSVKKLLQKDGFNV